MNDARRPNAGRPWTAEEDATLRRLAEVGEPPRRIAERLGRSLVSVSSRAATLRVSIGQGGPARAAARKDARRRDKGEPPPE